MSEESGKTGLFARLRAGLARSTGELTAIFTKMKLDELALAQLEEALLRTDMGAEKAREIVREISKGRYDEWITDAELRGVLATEVARTLRPLAKPFEVDRTKAPFVVLVAGVNGTGKTTTIGKIGRRLAGEGLSVMLAAGDTFRAAAIEQLEVWGQRAGAEVVARAVGTDAAGVAFEALERAKAAKADVLLIDTAGRLQNKAGLMAELEKIVRVLRKLDPSAPHATLLVLDATTGQNAVAQVEAFSAAVPLTGLIMTKLDGTARGGTLVALSGKSPLPVHFVGVGEGEEDLQAFDPERYARALTGAP